MNPLSFASLPQPHILKPVPAHSLHLVLSLRPNADRAMAIGEVQSLLAHTSEYALVLGLGHSLCSRLRLRAPAELTAFSTPAGSKVKLPQTHGDLWIWLRSALNDASGLEQGKLLARQRGIVQALASAFDLSSCEACFRHGEGRDLTGYEDGTENPKGKKALAAAIAADGSSFVALQKWQHQWQKIDAMSELQRNHAIGRVRTSNDEIESAPESAHVKRTAQEDFTLSDGSLGFSLRRSMPWSDGQHSGLMFTSFGKNFEAFEAQLAKMTGAVDGITDALFKMSKPVSGAYFWCPPVGHRF
jgi:putative iron-dependent peroxidase